VRRGRRRWRWRRRRRRRRRRMRRRSRRRRSLRIPADTSALLYSSWSASFVVLPAGPPAL
jgi:hypothetical protein